jgi:hypothetical protein
VDNARTTFASNSTEVFDVMQKSMNEGAVVMASRRMHNHSRWFVYDKKICIVVNNVEW